MSRILLLLSLIVATGLLLSCANGSNANSNNASQSNSNANALSPSSSASPTPMPIDTAPTIPANAAAVPKGTATPGVDSKNAMTKIKPGATPTPGVPDQETIRRQMGSNTNAALAPPGGGMMMRKSPPKPVATPTP